jgi:hypothetical protein
MCLSQQQQHDELQCNAGLLLCITHAPALHQICPLLTSAYVFALLLFSALLQHH